MQTRMMVLHSGLEWWHLSGWILREAGNGSPFLHPCYNEDLDQPIIVLTDGQLLVKVLPRVRLRSLQDSRE